jgi:hypothetical protein
MPSYPISLSDEERARVIQIMAEEFGLPPETTEAALDKFKQLTQPLAAPDLVYLKHTTSWDLISPDYD